MSEKRFQLRLACRYGSSDNEIADLQVEIFESGAWRPLELSLHERGFQMFLSALLNCQHRYFKVNCAERGLLLTSAEGLLEVVTNADWEIKRLRVRFAGRLAAGSPTPDAIDYIVERLGHCPVSSNLKPIPERQAEVVLS